MLADSKEFLIHYSITIFYVPGNRLVEINSANCNAKKFVLPSISLCPGRYFFHFFFVNSVAARVTDLSLVV